MGQKRILNLKDLSKNYRKSTSNRIHITHLVKIPSFLQKLKTLEQKPWQTISCKLENQTHSKPTAGLLTPKCGSPTSFTHYRAFSTKSHCYFPYQQKPQMLTGLFNKNTVFHVFLHFSIKWWQYLY